eukprot:scaffold436370_cov49-Prasinocladus_malaysianus.AAC.2
MRHEGFCPHLEGNARGKPLTLSRVGDRGLSPGGLCEQLQQVQCQANAADCMTQSIYCKAMCTISVRLSGRGDTFTE